MVRTWVPYQCMLSTYLAGSSLFDRTRIVWCIGKKRPVCVATEWIRSWDPPSPHLFGGSIWKILILPWVSSILQEFYVHFFREPLHGVLVVLSANSIWLVSEQVHRFVRVWPFSFLRATCVIRSYSCSANMRLFISFESRWIADFFRKKRKVGNSLCWKDLELCQNGSILKSDC